MHELTADEIELVSGGSLTLAALGFGLALAGKLTATSGASWAISSAGFVLATYGLAKEAQENSKAACDESTPLPGSENGAWSDPFNTVGHIIDPQFGEHT